MVCKFNELPFAGQSGVSSPRPDASKFEPTNFLGFTAVLIAEQLTKIETVSSPTFCHIHLILTVEIDRLRLLIQ